MAQPCFQIITFNGDHTLEYAIKSVQPFGPVIVTEGPVGYYVRKGFTTSTDRTNEILDDLVGPENVIHGQWQEKDQMVNAPLRLVPKGTTHLFAVDDDEIWKPEDLRKIFSIMDDWDSMSFKAWSFYGGFDRIITGFEEQFEVFRVQRWYEGARWHTHRPPTILAPDGRPWREHWHMEHVDTARIGLRFYHYSFVFPLRMAAKIGYYLVLSGKAAEIPNYMENVFLPWVMGSEETRKQIEDKYQGVHDWIPSRRGPAYTAPFLGEHPQIIKDAMPKLMARFEQELQQLGSEGAYHWVRP